MLVKILSLQGENRVIARVIYLHIDAHFSQSTASGRPWIAPLCSFTTFSLLTPGLGLLRNILLFSVAYRFARRA
jgi:hypothetical protein